MTCLKRRVLVLALIITSPATEYSYSLDVKPNDVIGAATAALTKFNGLSILANALIDKAIEKGNSALEQRLEQVNGIIQSAIFNLNQTVKERVQDLDQKVRVQRMEAIKQLNDLSVNISNSLNASIDQLNQVLEQNITGFQNALGNSFASLPIPTEPLINAGPNGLVVIASALGSTRLFVTGSGLFKDGRQPIAYVHDGPNDTAGTRLSVESASMGLLTLVLPSQLLPSGATPKLLTLSLGFYKGLLSKVVWPSFPLTVCGALPRYTARATVTAANGEYWEKSQTASPGQWFYVDDPKKPYTITAQNLTPPGWTVDTDRPGFVGGLNIVWNPPTSPGGNGDHHEDWTTNHDGYVLSVGNNNSNSHAYAVAAYKKVTNIAQCGTSQQTLPLDYSSLNQLHFQMADVIGNCDTSLRTPDVGAVVELMRQGNVVETVNLSVPRRDQPALSGQVLLSIDEKGLLNITLKPSC